MSVLLAVLLAACGGTDAPQLESSPDALHDSHPNILLIVADDLGYSDLGVYGGEIGTPNLDALVRGGLRFTQFYASPMCSPTRAMLLTGVDHHRAGLGNLAERLAENQKGQPGYEGRLNERVVTLAELLRRAGYRTFMAGKWHLGSGPADPVARGFDRAFALLESGAGHFANMQPLLGPGKAEYSEDGVPVTSLPDDFYSSRFYVQKLIEYLDAQPDSGRPFFAYLSFTAPHFPLQARRETIEKYRGRYDGGYDDVMAARLESMRRAGLVPADVNAFPQLASEPPWTALDAEARRREARRMEIYAAMIDDLDTEVGTLLRFLKERKSYDDTVIVFLSDNGAEGHWLQWGLDPLVPWARTCCDNSLDNMGDPDSDLMLGPAWARVTMAPFRMFKGFTSEGGIRVPAFVHYPRRVQGGRSTSALATVKDVLPTVLDLADVTLPGTSFDGREIEAVQGRSLLPLLEGRADHVHPGDAVFGWEIFGKRALRQGAWKILWETADAAWWDAAVAGIKHDDWQLYNLETDPAELEDLSQTQPRRLDALVRSWQDYARNNGVIIPDRQRGY